MEPRSNIGFVCPRSAPKAGKYSGQDAAGFVGKWVKMAFDATNPVTGESTLEHMWVKVASLKDGKLVGELDNDPIMITEVQCGDSVTLTVDQIEDVTG
jgi:uncharacterized protein YegJ (DUF2314 family)